MKSEQSEVFLSDYDMFLLTGYKTRSRQVEQLRKMGMAFFVNGSGKPLVAKAVIEGRNDPAPQVKKWEPNFSVLKNR